MASNFLWVEWHLQNAAVKHRKYPTIVPNDVVRVNIKPTPGITKGHRPTYSPTQHTVIYIKGNYYYLIYIMYTNKLYHSHEL